MSGLQEKFLVSRTDGRDRPGGDRQGTRYFVLDPAHDEDAFWALKEYANCTNNDELANDLLDWLDEIGYPNESAD